MVAHQAGGLVARVRFPAPRQNKIRIPLHNKESARIEVRTVAPDANPYLIMYSLIKTGLTGLIAKDSKNERTRVKYLPGIIQTAISQFR